MGKCNNINVHIKAALRLNCVTYTEVAKDIGINARVFANKMNRRKQPNGNTARFTDFEKRYLSERFDVDVKVIE